MTLTSANRETITPSKAKIYLEYVYEKQRPLNKQHVKFLASQMKTEAFDPTGTIALAFQNGSKGVVVDGRHTLNAIIASGLSQDLVVARHETQNEKETSLLYSHFDNGKARTFSDSARAFDLDKKVGLSFSQINKLVAALRYIRAGFDKNKATERIPNEVLMDLSIQWKDFGVSFYQSISSCDGMIGKRMVSSPAMSIFLVIIKHVPEKGCSFVQQVAHDDGLRKGDPRKALNRFLLLNPQRRNNYSGTIATPGQISRGVTKAWNKFYRDVKLQNINLETIDPKSPIHIMGTSYIGTE